MIRYQQDQGEGWTHQMQEATRSTNEDPASIPYMPRTNVREQDPVGHAGSPWHSFIPSFHEQSRTIAGRPIDSATRSPPSNIPTPRYRVLSVPSSCGNVDASDISSRVRNPLSALRPGRAQGKRRVGIQPREGGRRNRRDWRKWVCMKSMKMRL